MISTPRTTRTARPIAALLGVALATTLTACGSSAGGVSDSGAAATGGPSSSVAAHAPTSHAATSHTATSRAATSEAAVGGGTTVAMACDVTDRATVAAVFAGAGKGTAGPARNCHYPLTSGPVSAINVYYFGTSADWDVEKKQAKQYTGPLTKLAIGDDAYIGAQGAGAVTVRKGAIIFAVQVLPTGMPDKDFFAAHEAEVESLAKKIAAQH